MSIPKRRGPRIEPWGSPVGREWTIYLFQSTMKAHSFKPRECFAQLFMLVRTDSKTRTDGWLATVEKYYKIKCALYQHRLIVRGKFRQLAADDFTIRSCHDGIILEWRVFVGSQTLSNCSSIHCLYQGLWGTGVNPCCKHRLWVLYTLDRTSVHHNLIHSYFLTYWQFWDNNQLAAYLWTVRGSLSVKMCHTNHVWIQPGF